ncbi:Fungalysin metallopeptidase-domain-containing protein [Syncephalis plumigaleata]|nr:Fungalysin metallopeptidase-domain-containing protein [Syncephalis plumigaleata]
MIIAAYVFVVLIALLNVSVALKLKNYMRIANFASLLTEVRDGIFAYPNQSMDNATNNPLEIGLTFAQHGLGIPSDNYTIKDKYYSQDSQTTHVYLQQLVDNIEVTNARLNINVHDEGRVIAYSNGFCTPQYGDLGSWLALAKPMVSSKDALVVVANYLNETIDASKITEHPYLPPAPGGLRIVLHGTLVPVWNLQYFEADVAADGTAIHRLMDWTGHASYRVVPLGHNNPVDTPRQLCASPAGWLTEDKSQNGTMFTSGNNVIACVPKYEGLNSRPICTPIASSANQTFDYPLDLSQSPEASANASVVNLFYMVNSLHDFFYAYGFDEISGNFQMDNFGKGGKGNDPVIAMTLDDSETNNSAFIPAPEGESPELHIYRYDNSNPRHDATFDNSVLAHEYTHGVTFRLVGGPSAGSCLGMLGSSGIGEGSGDFVAMWFELKHSDRRTRQFELGKYAFGVNPRTYPYSTDMKVNPTTYALFNNDTWAESHKLGEIWASTLYDMHWNLVDKLGFDPNIRSANLNRGNTLSMKLFINALKLMKCQPSFIDARDAILQAEKTLTKGAHNCELWKAFAKRGLGHGAMLNGTRNVTITGTNLPTYIDNVVESHELPPICNTAIKA